MTHVALNEQKYKTMVLVSRTFLWLFLVELASGQVHVIENEVTIKSEIVAKNKERNDKDIIVNTEHGAVRGYEGESGIVTFFDIPYGAFSAEQPFQAPTAPTPWETVNDKTEHSSRCPQLRDGAFVGSNECLTLTILKQKDAEYADVLFHIHGSSFVSGSGNPLIYDPRNIVPKGIILILPNYRLGPLGFLCLQNDTAPGNAGLKDLTLALNWTMNNIEAFGGNSTNIVVSGAGAAGALVEYLILSNSSNRFISKAITESGSALSPWAIDRKPLETAHLFFQRVTENEVTVDSDKALQNVNLEVLTASGAGIEFRPCIESESGFITESPWSLLQNRQFSISYMTGSANQAAMGEVLQLTAERLSYINRNFTQLLPNDLEFKTDDVKTKAALRVKNLYFGDNDICVGNRESLSLCYSDSQYLNGGIRSARLFAIGGAHVYFYEFSLDNASPINGSARGDSINYIFSSTDDTLTNDNNVYANVMRELMTNLWTNFIKNGTPSADNVEWKTLNGTYGAENEEEWLSIGSTVQMRRSMHADRLRLWNDLYNSYYVERNVAFGLQPSIYIATISSSFLAYLKL